MVHASFPAGRFSVLSSYIASHVRPTRMDSAGLGPGLDATHVLITGGAGHIRRVVVDHFLSAGSRVPSLDINQLPETDAQLGMVGGVGRRDVCVTYVVATRRCLYE
jgi:hypothetical protein